MPTWRHPLSFAASAALCGGLGAQLLGAQLLNATPASAATGVVNTQLSAPIVGIAAATGSGQGYWEAARDGGVFAFGTAGYLGSMGGHPLDAPIVGIASDPAAPGTGGSASAAPGYDEVASDGGIFAFGSAGFFGSMGGHPLDAPIVGMAVTPTGGGYYEVAADGGIFAFGSATFQGSMGGHPLDAPIVGMAVTPTRGGYYEVAADGGIFAFGGAPYAGSEGGQALAAPIVGMAGVSGGYVEAGRTGSVYALGTPYEGGIESPTPTPTPAPAPAPAPPLAAIVAITESQVGNTDAYDYGPTGSTWCGYFTSWVWASAGVPIPPSGEAVSVGTWALANGGTLLPPTSTPQPGDAVLWEAPYTSTAWPDSTGLSYANIEHVNIVTQVLADGDIVTVGGNEGGAVRQIGPFSPAGASSSFGQAIYAFVQPPA